MQACQIKIAKFVANLVPSNAAEKGLTLWKAGLLTGLPTHEANIIGNATMQALEIAKGPIATLADRALSRRTGQRTRMFNLSDVVAGSKAGAIRGAREAVEVLKGNAVDVENKAWDAGRQVTYNNPVLNAYTQGVFRSLSASDRIPRQMALERSLREQARIIASKTALLPGETVEGRMAQLLQVPTDEMVMRAVLDAEEATFNDNTPLAQVASKLKGTLAREGGGIGRVLGDVTMPFTRVPANVATRTVEYSPIGFVLAAKDIAQLYRMATNGDQTEIARIQRRAVDRLGRASVGTLPIIVGYQLAERGLMTSNYPVQQGEQAQWELEGKQPGAVLVGGRWHSVQRFAPFGNLMMLGAHLSQAKGAWSAENGLAGNLRQQAGMAGSLALTASTSIATTLTEQSFLQGVQAAQQAISDPIRKGESYLRQMEGSVVPAMVGRVAAGVDPVRRETGNGLLDPIQARLPGLSQGLPAKRDALGAEIPSGTGFLGNFLAPTAPKPDRTAGDPLRTELARIGWAPSRPKRDGKNGETPEQFYARREADGKELRDALAEAVQSEAYLSIEPEARWVAAHAPEELGRRTWQDVAREQQREFLKGITSAVRTGQTQERKASMEAMGEEEP